MSSLLMKSADDADDEFVVAFPVFVWWVPVMKGNNIKVMKRIPAAFITISNLSLKNNFNKRFPASWTIIHCFTFVDSHNQKYLLNRWWNPRWEEGGQARGNNKRGRRRRLDRLGSWKWIPSFICYSINKNLNKCKKRNENAVHIYRREKSMEIGGTFEKKQIKKIE